MLVLDRDGTILPYTYEQQAPRPQRGYAELAGYPEGELSGRIGRLLELAFEQLGLRSLEVRVRADDDGWYADTQSPADALELYPSELELEYGLD